MSRVRVRVATAEDREGLLAVAAASRYTKGASSPHYLNDASYSKGWVAVAELTDRDGSRIVGFYCVRHCVNKPHTSLYYIGVLPELQGKGVGSLLVRHIWRHSQHGLIDLVCDERNTDTLEWYLRHGFEEYERTKNKSGEGIVRMRCQRGSWR